MGSNVKEYIEDIISKEDKKNRKYDIQLEEDYFEKIIGNHLYVSILDEGIKKGFQERGHNIIGFLGEIDIEEEKDKIWFYSGSIESINYVKGNPFKPEFEKYIFVPDDIIMKNDKLVLEGVICDYEEAINYFDVGVWDKVMIVMDIIPKFKTTSSESLGFPANLS
jgi:hypothetical protein